jgi:hypothetical protein
MAALKTNQHRVLKNLVSLSRQLLQLLPPEKALSYTCHPFRYGLISMIVM